jgi:PleD family two-component response regulator
VTSAQLMPTTTARPGGGLRLLRGRRPMFPGGETEGSPAVRVLIADGQALVRAGLRVLLDADERISVVGEAASGEETVALAGQLRPDVVLIDAGLPGLD